MAAVEFSVEAFGTEVRDGAWFWAFGRSCFPRGFPVASRVKRACALPYGGNLRSSGKFP
jgi:hypothetical protein